MRDRPAPPFETPSEDELLASLPSRPLMPKRRSVEVTAARTCTAEGVCEACRAEAKSASARTVSNVLFATLLILVAARLAWGLWREPATARDE